MQVRRQGSFGRCAIYYIFDARLVGLGRDSEKIGVKRQEQLTILSNREEMDDAGAMPDNGANRGARPKHQLLPQPEDGKVGLLVGYCNVARV